MTHAPNFSEARILIGHQSTITSKLYDSILRGFGIRHIELVGDVKAARQALAGGWIDLAILDNSLGADDTRRIVAEIRRSETATAREIPILLTYGHSRYRDVLASRDSGANMVMTTPLTATAIYDRLAWLALKPRPFVESEPYCGPCRRINVDRMGAAKARRATDVRNADPADRTAADSELAIVG
ncbi:hypothetical protein [Minwuia sp.]|uniref:hypothetical protein n=1 Tax=Minwuia sp. TaxID=2493630 RepID=UPI003A923FA3